MAKKYDICVIGAGKFGNAVIYQLSELGHSIMAIDIKSDRIRRTQNLVDYAVVLDATDPDSLKTQGIERMDTVIVGVGSDVESPVMIAALLKELNIKNIICKASSQRHETILKQIGVDYIVRPEYEAGIRTALKATNPLFITSYAEIQEISDNYAMLKTIIKNINITTKPLASLDLRRIGVAIVTISRNGKTFVPVKDDILKLGDKVVIVGEIKAVSEFQRFSNKIIEK